MTSPLPLILAGNVCKNATKKHLSLQRLIYATQYLLCCIVYALSLCSAPGRDVAGLCALVTSPRIRWGQTLLLYTPFLVFNPQSLYHHIHHHYPYSIYHLLTTGCCLHPICAPLPAVVYMYIPILYALKTGFLSLCISVHTSTTQKINKIILKKLLTTRPVCVNI